LDERPLSLFFKKEQVTGDQPGLLCTVCGIVAIERYVLQTTMYGDVSAMVTDKDRSSLVLRFFIIVILGM
jgi:hypothetical protein